MNDAALPLLTLLRELFPDRQFEIDPHGVWRVTGRVLIVASTADELIASLASVEPERIEDVAIFFRAMKEEKETDCQ